MVDITEIPFSGKMKEKFIDGNKDGYPLEKNDYPKMPKKLYTKTGIKIQSEKFKEEVEE